MYLNLDLLYNTYNYIYPLFYYKYCNNDSECEVYSPITKKSVYINSYFIAFWYDFITKKYKSGSFVGIFDYTHDIYTENTINFNGSFILKKCKPFKLNKKDLYFLKSNTRIN